jgi:hypothetical protein
MHPRSKQRPDGIAQGRPFLYQTDEFMFVVVTEDDDSAAEALRQLR